MVGRASGRDFDARRDAPYPPYDGLDFKIPTRSEGDVNARIWVRIEEVGESLELDRGDPRAACPTDRFGPGSPLRASRPRVSRSSRRSAATCSRMCASTPAAIVARCHLRDASWFQWPLLEAAIEGNIVADFPLCNKSFNCSYSGCDL